MQTSISQNTRFVSTQHAPGTPIYANGKVIGRVIGHTFYKSVKASLHFLQRPQAICFDVSTLEQADKAGTTHAHITDSETGNVYTASLATIRKHGMVIDRGHGRQFSLILEHWNVNGQPSEIERRAASEASKQAAKAMVQLGLFGGAQ